MYCICIIQTCCNESSTCFFKLSSTKERRQTSSNPLYAENKRSTSQDTIMTYLIVAISFGMSDSIHSLVF